MNFLAFPSLKHKSSLNLEAVFLQGVYEIPSLMNHDCVGNTRLAMGADEDHRLSVFAATKIEAGTPILFNYVSSLETTDTRLRCKQMGSFQITLETGYTVN